MRYRMDASSRSSGTSSERSTRRPQNVDDVPAEESVADPAVWLAHHRWQATIDDAAERFVALGRAIPAMFSSVAAAAGPRRLARAVRLEDGSNGNAP